MALRYGHFTGAWARAGCASLLAAKLQKALAGRRAGFLTEGRTEGTAFFLRRLFTALQCKLNKRKMETGERSPDNSAYQSSEQ